MAQHEQSAAFSEGTRASRAAKLLAVIAIVPWLVCGDWHVMAWVPPHAARSRPNPTFAGHYAGMMKVKSKTGPRLAGDVPAAGRPPLRPSRPSLYFSRLLQWFLPATAALRAAISHRPRSTVQKAQSPAAEIVFALVLASSLREMVRNYVLQANSFKLRDELFEQIAVARTYGNSLMPWIQTGVVVLVGSFIFIKAVQAFMRSMKDWERNQELREMQNYGEESAWFLNTTITARPVQNKLKAEAELNAKKKGLFSTILSLFGGIFTTSGAVRLAACAGYLLPLLNILDFGEISISLYPYTVGVPLNEPVVNFLQNRCRLKYLYRAYISSGYWFLLVWFAYIQVAIRNKMAPRYMRFHSSQAILLSMLLGVPSQIFFAVLNPWESGLFVQNMMYFSMVGIFFFTLALILYCCSKALRKKEMELPLISEAATIWAGRE